jgi:hypothetical protein
MKKSFFSCMMVTLLAGSVAFAKWIDPDNESKKNHNLPAWQGVDFTFTGFSSSTGTSSISYHNAINDLWEWDVGTGVDRLGFFFMGGARYFVYNWPKTTCFFFFPCHGQVSTGMNLNYSTGGRKTFTDSGGSDSKYDQGSSISAWPTVAFRSIYRDFFSLTLDVGYRIMVQKPSISRGFGNPVPTAVDDMENANKDGLGAAVSLGIVF